MGQGIFNPVKQDTTTECYDQQSNLTSVTLQNYFAIQLKKFFSNNNIKLLLKPVLLSLLYTLPDPNVSSQKCEKKSDYLKRLYVTTF